ncbi:MAG: hypothetical protein ACXWLR_01165 [Myxococcales bacterium]
MRTAWLLLGGMLCGGALYAQGPAPAPGPNERRPDPEKPPLSKEDAELVKDLALLERVDLLRNLDLFEKDRGEKQTREDVPR